MMEKNAVAGPSRAIHEKIASRGCPVCGSQLDFNGSLPRCPKHGTAPFEAGARMSKASSFRWRNN